MGACEALATLMNLDVLVQVGLLGEFVLTAFVVAAVRAFVSVDTQVVEEVVPFAKDLSAAITRAMEKFLGILACDTEELIDVEAGGVGHVLLDAHLVQVERLTLMDNHKGVWINHLSRNAS